VDQSRVFLPCLVLLIPLCLRTWMDHTLSILKRSYFTKVQRWTCLEEICYRGRKVKYYIDSDVLHASCVLLHVQLRPLLFRVNPDQMGQEELLNMILIWQSVFTADSARLLVQLMQSFKDQTSKMQQWLTKSSFTTRRNCLKTETDGSHNWQEILKAKSEVDLFTYVRFFIL